MEDNNWKMREIVRKIEQMQTRLNKLRNYLEERIDEGSVSDELLRSLSSPTEELEWRISSIEQNLAEE